MKLPKINKEQIVSLLVLYLSAILSVFLFKYLIPKGHFWIYALPFVFFGAYFFLVKPDWLILTLVFLTPLSIEFGQEKLGFSIDIPTEPILVLLMLWFFFRLFFYGKADKTMLRHPISIAIILSLTWMLITVFFSELPIVSVKYFFSRLWFVSVFYFLALELFKSYNHLKRYFWAFGISLVIVILITTIKHSFYGFDRKAGIWVVGPFFNDHTIYSAVISLIAPMFLAWALNTKASIQSRLIGLAFFAINIAGILFSYSRASWVSFFAGLGVFFLMYFKVKAKYVLPILALVIIGVFSFQKEIQIALEKNQQESSGDFMEHFKSISNVTSDASNLERINRWKSAIKLWEERPVTGWGPGTYQFVYAPYQVSEDLTIISTNIGDVGNAHSEYLGPLAETGLPGLIFYSLIVIITLITGIRLNHKLKDKEARLIAIGCLAGLFTYFVHGFLNNFLDTDKASALFWGLIAILVALDAYHPDKKENKNTNPDLTN